MAEIDGLRHDIERDAVRLGMANFEGGDPVIDTFAGFGGDIDGRTLIDFATVPFLAGADMQALIEGEECFAALGLANDQAELLVFKDAFNQRSSAELCRDVVEVDDFELFVTEIIGRNNTAQTQRVADDAIVAAARAVPFQTD